MVSSLAAASDHQLAKRPGIGHLILWMSCCAILFALSRSFLPERPAGLVGILLLSLLAAIYGACWAGCLVVVYRCLRSARPQIEPGEWLLFCLGLILAVEVVTKLLPDQFIIQKPSLQLAADCGVLVIPTLSRRLATRWKLLFVGFVLSYALPLCIVLGETLGLWPSIQLADPLSIIRQMRPYILSAMLAAVVILDAREKHCYSWSHWLGVACTALWVLTKWL